MVVFNPKETTSVKKFKYFSLTLVFRRVHSVFKLVEINIIVWSLFCVKLYTVSKVVELKIVCLLLISFKETTLTKLDSRDFNVNKVCASLA